MRSKFFLLIFFIIFMNIFAFGQTHENEINNSFIYSSDLIKEIKIGLSHMEKSNYRYAKAIFRRLGFRPDSPSLIYFSLGLILLQEGKTKRALSEFLTAVEINPDNAANQAYLSLAYKLTGNLDLAKKHREMAAGLPDFTDELKGLEEFSFTPVSVNPIILQIISIIALFISIIIHEIAHGFIALKLGDKTAQEAGRLTLNPLKHIDPVGSVLLPAILVIMKSSVVFGWAKPVPINLNNTKNKRLSDVLISFAGPASNIILTIVSLLILKICLSLYTVLPPIVSMFLLQMAIINLFLPIINLLPIPPLDGSHLIANVLPEKIKIQYQKLGYVGFFLLYFVLQLPLINTLFETVWNFLIELLDLPFP